MKRYFVSFTYKKVLIGGDLSGDILTFEIIDLDNGLSGVPTNLDYRSNSKEGVLLALNDRGYNLSYCNILQMNPL